MFVQFIVQLVVNELRIIYDISDHPIDTFHDSAIR